MSGLVDPSRLRVAEVWHENVPTVGERHRAEDCPGGGAWPCGSPLRNRVDRVARAIHRAYSLTIRQPAWDDLHDDAKEAWRELARAAIKAMSEDPLVTGDGP